MLAGDANGLNVLKAAGKDGYAWETVATLSQEGLQTDRWIGNACATASGRRLVVTYAPRGFTNSADLSDRGAFTSVVDLSTGEVRRLPVLSSLSSFTPSCGLGEDALLTVAGGEEIEATRLVKVDAVAATVAPPIEVGGQVTSAILTSDGIVAAAGLSVVKVGNAGRLEQLTPATSAPYGLTRDYSGGVVYLDHERGRASVHRLDRRRIKTAAPAKAPKPFAVGALDEVDITASATGKVLVTGESETVGDVPATVTMTEAPTDSAATILGEATISVESIDVSGLPVSDTQLDPTVPSALIDLSVRSVATGESGALSVRPNSISTAGDQSGLAAGASPPSQASVPDATRVTPTGVDAGKSADTTRSSAAAAAQGEQPAGSSSNPIEAERACSVPMNDPRNQALQPKPRQVEWAVNQAVNGALNVARPANYKSWGLPAYTPQGMFPNITLTDSAGKPSTTGVPSQVLLGLFAQESNLWMTPGYAAPGLTANPLVGRYWGQDSTLPTADEKWAIDWNAADCGYGIGQVTDGMRREAMRLPTDTTVRTTAQQRAIALDFAANVAASLQILETKWNETGAAGVTINDGNPARIENWYYALWAYNSGFHPEAAKNSEGNNGAWGLGWLNNPINPRFMAGRGSFGENPNDFTHPGDWPYQERVLGFAAYPPSLFESPGVEVPAFRPATWNGTSDTAPKNRRSVQPPSDAFCVAANQCNPSDDNYSYDGVWIRWGACGHKNPSGQYDGKCWVHWNTTWKTNCDLDCGRPFLRFSVGYAYQADGDSYPPACTRAGLPANALVIDDIPTGTPVPRCQASSSSGTFTFLFNGRPDGTKPSKSDLHQIGGGYGGHFWFAHTRNSNVRDNSMAIKGTWKLDRPLNQWARVLVHLPSLGAHTRQATYTINLGYGQPKKRTILQRTMKNGWVSLGVFQVNGTPSIDLSTVTLDGDAEDASGEVRDPKNEDIAFDAVAFEPLPAKPKNIVVALGDSYSSGEGGTVAGAATSSYYAETDFFGNERLQDNCHRSPYTWSRVAQLTDSATPIGARADALDVSLDYHLLACSGAVVRNVLPSGTKDAEGLPSEGQHSELPQLDQGFLDENTTLVTMSIGGNDAQFGPIVTKCTLLPRCDIIVRNEPAHITGPVTDSIVLALKAIRTKAPNAQIMIMGYPELLSGPAGECSLGLSASDHRTLNYLADILQEQISVAADRVNDIDRAAPGGKTFVNAMNPQTYFSGKAICGTPEDVHGILLNGTPGEGGKMPSQQSFHPKIEGYQLYGQVLTDALRKLQ
ncbi:hypothetical protein IC607_02135 [Cellulomonas sp. JH27-2]|uniref:GDSL-type esterase/lipase family protein n=1 Tax=Cellulomonas sp. JH27-2 TaxID=2774139 RepID=UPI00177E561F|nr:GDSL-type esterase/lipase family protein [Cellulomonas sp. JH27-2]MBD8057767.1 hypothetical protein [Cellulomonas sp. JH27-2]